MYFKFCSLEVIGNYSREVIILNISVKGNDYSVEAITGS